MNDASDGKRSHRLSHSGSVLHGGACCWSARRRLLMLVSLTVSMVTWHFTVGSGNFRGIRWRRRVLDAV
jgi:hypothetical protein